VMCRRRPLLLQTDGCSLTDSLTHCSH